MALPPHFLPGNHTAPLRPLHVLTAPPPLPHSLHRHEAAKWRSSLIFSLVFALPLFVLSMSSMLPAFMEWEMRHLMLINQLPATWLVEWALATPVQFMAGDTFFTAAWSGENDERVDESVGRLRCWLAWLVEWALAAPAQFMAWENFNSAA